MQQVRAVPDSPDQLPPDLVPVPTQGGDSTKKIALHIGFQPVFGGVLGSCLTSICSSLLYCIRLKTAVFHMV